MPAPLAALAARLGPIVAQIAVGGGARGGAAAAGGRLPMGLTMNQGRAMGMGLSSMPPQRIGAGDIVGGGGGERAARTASLFGDLAKKLPPVIAGLAALPAIAHGLSNRFLEAQKHLAQYNGTIAASMAKLEVARIGRSIRSGTATAGSTRELADSTNRLEEQLAPIGNFATNAKNWFSDALNEAVIFALKGIAPLFKELNGALFEQEKPKPAEFQLFLDNRRNEWLDDQKKRREPALNLNRPNE